MFSWKTLVLASSIGLLAGTAVAGPVGSGITYQGDLTVDGLPGNGNATIEFALYDASFGGSQVGSTIATVASVENGRFTAEDLDFGSGSFDGNERWLEVTVDGVTLSPRQPVAPAPYALHAVNAPFDVNGSAVYYNGGSLGLGSDTPEAILSIENVGSNDTTALLNFSENENPEFYFESGFAGTNSNGNFLKLQTLWDNAMTWRGDGHVGVRNTNPLVQFHVTETPITFDIGAINGDDQILEDNDAVFGVYSGGGGSAGSAIALGEIDGGVYADKWSIARETSGVGSGLRFSYNTDNNYFNNPQMRLTPTGELGLGTGTAAPAAKLDIFDTVGPAARIEVDNPALADGAVKMISNGQVFGHSTLRVELQGALFAAGVFEAPDAIAVYANGGSRGVWCRATGNGGLPLIAEAYGTIVPENIALFNAGGFNRARIDSTGRGFFNGGTQTGGADVAEAFEVEGGVDGYEPGDVLVISTESDRTMAMSDEPYSTLVAGVYATKPGLLLSERDISESHDDMVPMGVVGVIPTKVSAENGPIRRGDLLVSAGLPGHAMKGTDRDQMIGAIIGKALENFEGPGTGVIRVMVNVK